ncbi:gluconolactonase [Rhodoferax koreense]|uniref:Gluconolactonase n=1 Tax=Rhodoferax koreensis TaxID=1842727 RepID=A0A1P8JVU2_9BURK|nr:SMP-30/gluconolactonase/LRE family protein [Rhodoferax koreense]APW37801.1 gluconolactonase [Rhodoferax koreense]
MNAVPTVGTSRDRVGESPVWDVRSQALYWVDIEGQLIRRWDPASETLQSWRVPERVGCIALSAKAGGDELIAAMETGVYAVTLLPSSEVALRCLAKIVHPAPGMRFNDGRCDAQGRFWIGTMVMNMGLASPLGALYCLDENGLSAPKVEALITPNGLGFSPDGRTAYLSDSHPSVQRIWAFDFDGAAATLANPREFVDMTSLPGRPDGAAVDAEGHYWICGNDAGKVHRFDPSGRLVASLDVPVAKPAMCAFGGADLDVLYVTSILPATVAADAPGLNGAVFALKPGVRGLPEPVFSRFPK